MGDLDDLGVNAPWPTARTNYPPLVHAAGIAENYVTRLSTQLMVFRGL